MSNLAAPATPTAGVAPPSRNLGRRRVLTAALLLLAGIAWLLFVQANRRPQQPAMAAQTLTALGPGAIASMDSPALVYSPGWRITPLGADPGEPADPWREPAGVLTFDYRGSELALNLAAGDYWAYLYVTVDGQPANLLPNIRGNVDSRGKPAGYRTFYAPEQPASGDGGAAPRWQRVHRATDDLSRGDAIVHTVRVEVWRGWDQTPLRGIAVDALPPMPAPRWPGVLLAALALAVIYPSAARLATRGRGAILLTRPHASLAALFLPSLAAQTQAYLAIAAGALAAAGVLLAIWPLAAAGLALLAYLAVSRPALWSAAVVFALPFYFSYSLPLPQQREVSLIDALLLAGMALAAAHWLLFTPPRAETSAPASKAKPWPAWLLAAIIGWALVSVFAAEHFAVALREWRTVFLSAGLFAVLLGASLRASRAPSADLWLIVAAWLAGGVVVAAVGLGQYLAGASLISAEGVYRIHAFYGSPNNLALYLERTFLVTLALAAFLPSGRARLLSVLAAALQGLALLLTFSKGSLFLGIPTGLAALWLGGMILLPRQGRSRRPLLWLGGAAALFALALLPFLATERFQRLLDFSQGTGFLRLQLWRSAWQMGLDHPWLGVGPDNFLYAYRSFYILPQAWQEPNLNHPHNWILDWWTRLGLPGLALALIFFGAGMAGLWRRARESGPSWIRRACAMPRSTWGCSPRPPAVWPTA